MRGSAHQSLEVVRLGADAEVAGRNLVPAPWLGACEPYVQKLLKVWPIPGESAGGPWPIRRTVEVDFHASEQYYHGVDDTWSPKGNNNTKLGSVELKLIHVLVSIVMPEERRARRCSDVSRAACHSLPSSLLVKVWLPYLDEVAELAPSNALV